MNIFDKIKKASTVEELIKLKKDAEIQSDHAIKRIEEIRQDITLLIKEEKDLEVFLHRIDPREQIKYKIGELIIQSNDDL